MVVNKSCVAAYLGGWPDGRGLSGRMRVERVAGSPWNRWPDAHGMGGRMAVESALLILLEAEIKCDIAPTGWVAPEYSGYGLKLLTFGPLKDQS